jgi:RNA-directed DNA polymerase
LIHKLNPKIRGWANYYRTWVCQATFGRLDRLTWVKLRSWARRRHPKKSAGWVDNRYWPHGESRRVFATPATRPSQAYLASHSDTASLRHAKVAGNRSPYDGDWVYWSQRQGRYPMVSSRLATLLKRQRGRCTYCGLFFQHADQLEIDHINGKRQDSRYANLQVLHGHCHDAKTRDQAEHLPVGRPTPNTRVTSRQVTPCGCDQHQCQIGSLISCGRKRHEINVRHIHRTAPNRLKPNGTDVASNDSYSRLLQLAGGARLFELDP